LDADHPNTGVNFACQSTDSGSAWPVPDSITATPGSVRKTIKRMIANGMLEEVPSTNDHPIWREDGDLGFGIVITETGMAALGLDKGSGSSNVHQTTADGPNSEDSGSNASRASDRSRSDDPAGLPRHGTKLGMVLELLNDKKGTSIEKMMDATGWQAHSVRAAMTGLRKRGITIERSKSKDGLTVYLTAAD